MTGHSKKDIVESLQSRFPRLAEDIERCADAIVEAHSIVQRSSAASFKRDRATIETLAKSGAIPGAVAKYFISQLIDPPEEEISEEEKRWLGITEEMIKIRAYEISRMKPGQSAEANYFEALHQLVEERRPPCPICGVSVPWGRMEEHYKTAGHKVELFPSLPPPARVAQIANEIVRRMPDATFTEQFRALQRHPEIAEYVRKVGVSLSDLNERLITAREAAGRPVRPEEIPAMRAPPTYYPGKVLIPEAKRAMPSLWSSFHKVAHPFGAAVREGRPKIREAAKKFSEEKKKWHKKDIEYEKASIATMEKDIKAISARIGELEAKEKRTRREAEELEWQRTRRKELEKVIESETKRLKEEKPKYPDEKFPKELESHLKAKAGEFAAELGEKYGLSSDRIAELRSVLEGEAADEALRWRAYLSTEKAAAKAWRPGYIGMRGADIARDILTGFWGVWGGVIGWVAGSLPVGLIILFIWGALRFPPIFSVAVIWAQIAFLVGGSVLLAAPFPGYTGMETGTLITALVVGAAANLIFNMRRQAGAMPIIAHMLGGGVITLTAIMGIFALQAFGAGGWTFGLLAAVAVGFLVFVVYYPNGYPRGLESVNIIALVVLAFSYFALGPYSATVIQTVDQVKAPFAAAHLATSTAVSDIWLLLTDPTKYYAQQQLRAARPERPISFPVAVELSRLDAVPEGTVPAGSNFVIFALAENQGDLIAENVTISAACVPGAPPEVKCTGGPYTWSPTPASLRPGEAARTDFKFEAVGRTGREAGQRIAETVFSKVNVTLSYTLNTSSSLQVEVATKAEIDKRYREKVGKVFYPQVAIAKVGPAQIGINVGPQPIEADKAGTTLVVSISNTRPDGSLVLDGKELKINLSPIVGDTLICAGGETKDKRFAWSECAPAGGQACVIKITKGVVRPYETRDVLPIYCTFKAAAVPEARTGLITAELVGYRFNLTKEKSIAVGQPVGVIPLEVVPPVKMTVEKIKESQRAFASEINTALEKYPLTDLSDSQARALVAAVITQESRWNSTAFNTISSATGLMQIVPTQAGQDCRDKNIIPNNDIETLKNVQHNLNCGVWYLARQMNACKSIEGALANYYCGPTAAKCKKDAANCQKYTPPTRQYVDEVMAFYNALQAAPSAAATPSETPCLAAGGTCLSIAHLHRCAPGKRTEISCDLEGYVCCMQTIGTA